MTLAILRDELLTDPLGRGYAGMTDQQAADDLNTAYRTRLRSSVSPAEVVGAFEPADIAGVLTGGAAANNYYYLSLLLQDQQIPLNNPNVNTVMKNIWAGKTATLNNLLALENQQITRAQEIGIGFVHAGDVGAARA